MTPAVAHTLVGSLIVVCYTILSALGHDGNALLAVLGGQAIGAGVQAATSSKDEATV